MRKLWIVGVVASSMSLAACGVSATINQAVSSIGSSPTLQVHLTASASGANSAQVIGALNALSVNMNYSSTTGSALSQSTGNINTEVTVNDNAQTLVDLRAIGTDVYVEINPTAFASIPGTHFTSQQLTGLQLLVGGRWFDFSEGFIKSVLPTTTISAAQTSKEQTAVRSIIDALSALIEKTPYTTISGGGYSQTGTLESVVNAALPAIDTYAGKTITPHSVKGSYTIGFTMSGATATGGSIAITAPNGTSGTTTVDLHATLTHNNVPVVTPTGATVVTRAMLTQLLGQVSSTSTPLG